jgi:hypothetical protein
MSEPKHPDGSIVDIVDRGKKITVVEVDEDRCFTCGHKAFVYAELKSGLSVALCGHHATEAWGKLNEQARPGGIIDMRHLIGVTNDEDDEP